MDLDPLAIGTHQVCDLGRALSDPDFSIVKRLGPSLP